MKVQKTSQNLKLTCGSEIEPWNKVMKEVKLKHFVGPFENIPFEFYIQSPIGLVPKDGGKSTRLIFHLLYPRTDGTSVNANTLKDQCTVHYNELDDAIAQCLEEGKSCKMAKSDMSSAFRNLGMSRKFWPYLVLKARNPKDQKIYFFVNKYMPFGASISCAHFQKFSDAVAHIV